MKTRLYKMTAGALALVTSLTLVACDDDPVEVEEDHHDPVGLVISTGGVDLVTIQGAAVTGTLTVDAGMETAHLDVEFLDDDGDRFTPEDADEWLRVTMGDETVAEWEQDSLGEFGGHLHGEAAGATTAVFELMHGTVGAASSHPDYTSPSVPVVIN
jgi:hypothetical protein